MDFKCSKGYLHRFSKRNDLKLTKKTTTKQQSWNDWMAGIRTLSLEMGIVTNGFIEGNNAWNLD